MSLSHDEASRLAFIRYLHHQGVQQARLPEPQSSAAVLLLHDAVEAFLLLAAEHLGTAPPREFGQYLGRAEPGQADRWGEPGRQAGHGASQQRGQTK